MTDNKRKHPRLAVPMQIELIFSDDKKILLTTRDISDGGIFLEIPDGEIPALNSRIELKVKANLQGEEPQKIAATVVRVTSEGIGIRFDDTDN